MSVRSFFGSLFIFTVVWSALLLAVLCLFPGAWLNWPMAISASGLFVLICIILFWAGLRAIRSPNRNAFTGVVMASVFAKMMLSLLLLFIYRATVHPEGKWFVGLFLLSYLAYTSFEVWFLYRLTRQQGKPKATP